MKAQEQIKQYHSQKLPQVGELSISLAKVGKGKGGEERGKEVTDMIDCSVIILMVRLTCIYLSATW